MRKRITFININKLGSNAANALLYTNDYINPLGDTRDIDINGTPGAMFSLEITNEAGKSILKSPIKNQIIPSTGMYSFTQIYPKTIYGDTYTVKITPLVNTILSGGITNIYYQYQYINPIITFTYTTADPYGGSGSYSGSDKLIYGLPKKAAISMSSVRRAFGRETHTVTATHSSQVLYTSLPNFDRDYTNNRDISKTVNIPVLNNNVVRVVPNTSRLNVDTRFTSKTTFTKTLKASIKEVNIKRDVDIDSSIEETSKFKINNVSSLLVGMSITGDGVKQGTTLKSIENEQEIILSIPQKLQDNTILTFKSNINGTIATINNHDTITVDRNVNIPGGSILTFNDNQESVRVSSSVSGSGTNTITITNNIIVDNFGKESSTYTQDIDSFIKLKPNVYSQYLETKKATSVYNEDLVVQEETSGTITINVLAPDKDANVSSKTPSNESQDAPKNGTLISSSWAAGVGTCTYTPNKGFIGQDVFYFYVSDGTTLSERTPIYITVK